MRQASDFMAAQCRTAQCQTTPPRTTKPPVSLSGWGGRRLQLGGLLAGLLLVSLAALLAGRTPADGATLAGAAVGGAPLSLLLTFVGGALAGGVIVAWWGSWSRRR
jgi:hypothetical protein